MSTWPGFLWLFRTLVAPGSVSRASLEGFRNASLRRLVCHSYRHVPYYRRLFDDHGLDPEGIRSVEDLKAIPITTSEDLARQVPEDLISANVNPEGLIETATSGTTGHPRVVRKSWLETRLHLGFLLRANRSFGLRIRDRVAGVGVAGHRHPRDRRTLGIILSALGILRSSRVDASLDLQGILHELDALQPDVVTGWASMIESLAGGLLDGRGSPIRPRFVMTGGEVLPPHRRQRISAGFSAPVFDVYSSTEFHMIGWECNKTGRLHLCDDSLFVEVLRGDEEAAPGEDGEIVGTSLHSFSMPFIRFRLGDVVTRGVDQCSCGAPYATIGKVLGRNTGYLNFSNGRIVHAAFFDHSVLAERSAWVAQYQFIQERLDHMVLRVVPSDSPEPALVRELKKAVESLVGPEVQVDLLLVDEIRRPGEGKQGTVLSSFS